MSMSTMRTHEVAPPACPTWFTDVRKAADNLATLKIRFLRYWCYELEKKGSRMHAGLTRQLVLPEDRVAWFDFAAKCIQVCTDK